jgi:very-short-patch-repair endonuclease
MDGDAEIRDRTKRLYQYLRELVLLRQVGVRKFTSYEHTMLLCDLPLDVGCFFAPRDATNEIDTELWLELRHPKLETPPKPPEVLNDWLDPAHLADPTNQSLELVGTDDPDETEIGADPPEDVVVLLREYETSEWRAWASRTLPKHRLKRLYDDLFKIYQKQEQLGESFEIVFGFGLLSWRTSSAVEIQRHLITVQAVVEFDSRRQILSVKPASTQFFARFEEDMVDPLLRPAKDIRKSVSSQVSQLDSSVWDSNVLFDIHREYGNALDHDAVTDSISEVPPSIGTSPVVSFTPALILRRRGSEGLIDLMDQIIERIDEGDPIPTSVVQQVSIMEADNGQPTEDQSGAEPDTEIYFPLPANREQLRIIDLHRMNHGVVVEGPPGTGKSQTIANLVSHLLATGKRVLVTSHTVRALQVLRDKIPESLQPLCVQALANDSKGMQVLESSVRGITDRHLTWDHNIAEEGLRLWRQEVDKSRGELQRAIHEHRALREVETYEHVKIAGVYDGTLGRIARMLSEEAESLGFVEDDISLETACPCTGEEFQRLIADFPLLSRSGESHAWTLDIERLPKPEVFERLVGTVKSGTDFDSNELSPRMRQLLAGLDGRSAASREMVLESLRKFRAKYQGVLGRKEQWVSNALLEILSERDRKWAALLKVTKTRIEAISSVSNEVLEARVSGFQPGEYDVARVHALLLRDHKSRNPKGLAAKFFAPKEVKAATIYLEPLRINGFALTENTKPLDLFVSWLDCQLNYAQVEEDWKGLDSSQEGSLLLKLRQIEDRLEPLEVALELLEDARTLTGHLNSSFGVAPPDWGNLAAIEEYESVFELADRAHKEQAASLRLAEAIELAQAEIRAIPVADLRNQLNEALRQRDVGRYESAFSRLELEMAEAERGNQAWLIFNRIREHAPRLASRLLTDPAFAQARVDQNDFERAWTHGRAVSWLKSMTNPVAYQSVLELIGLLQRRIAQRLGRIAEASAWSACFKRLTESQRVALNAWALKVKQIGKGTGKYAAQHRRSAQSYLAQCQPAIPAWIMPMHRVAETIRPGRDKFDVVIIDEASQSGPEALVLLFLAERIIVVGDAKQISPDSFTEIAQVNRLRSELIADLPANDALDPANSMFDLAKIRYKARVQLVEHFRCMPEIIQFSNELCYLSEPLIPLKQFGSNRLTPPIRTVHVETGFVKGERQKVNLPEAIQISRTIAKLTKQPEYKGKSFGVISLLGSHQAEKIKSELMTLLDSKEFEERNLRIGDAYEFQGDERDVMFLSMVAAPGPDRRIPALADPTGRDTRRYNVAFSRARDQVWLFHSPTLNDLSPNDLRFKLLKYCLNPTRREHVSGINLDDLEILCRRADKGQMVAPEPFDSWFEVEVFLAVARRGYEVIPQYDVYGYKLDMAIIGSGRKLAVECDGEFWHGPDRWDSDAARQRDLERCGWPFFRLRESAYYLEPEVALQPLWEELAKHGIKSCFEPTEEEENDDRSLDLGAEEPSTECIEEPADDPTWQFSSLPDPKSESRDRVIEALTEIVLVEGPTSWRVVFDNYRVGLGLGRLKGPTREALEAAAKQAVHGGRLVESVEVLEGDWYTRYVRRPEQPAILIRPRGRRAFEDIPPSEIALLITEKGWGDIDEETLFKRVLNAYDLKRRTEQARAHFGLARQGQFSL